MTKIMSVSLPEEQMEAVTRLAKRSKRSRSHLVQEALDQYVLKEEWKDLRRIGDQIAKRLGIESDDDVEKYFG